MDAIDFGALYERHSRDVFRFAVYLTGNRADAEDVTAETFARAWAAHGEIRTGTVKAYLLMIARNLWLEWGRSRKRTTVLEMDPRDPAAGPEGAAAWRDELRLVLTTVASLPELDRAALLMRACGGLSYDAIGAALGLTVGSARLRVHRARQKLRQAPSSPEDVKP
jgi:RNA polymerase sigma-70 factor (ECF subfamily)